MTIARPRGVSAGAPGLPQFASRRRFLGGAAVAISLPFLPSLYRREARAAARPPAPRRLIVYHVPNGFHRASFTPEGVGRKWTLSPTLAALEDLKADILIPRGIANTAAVPMNAGGAHAVGCAALLTGCYPRIDRVHTGISVDQVAARALAEKTRLPSLQLGMDGQRGVDENGWPAVYQQHISWASPAMPLPNVGNPMKAFARMFQGFDPTLSRADAERRRTLRASVLDTVANSATNVSGQLNAADREKLDEYLTSIREFEVRTTRAGGGAATSCKVPQQTLVDANGDYVQRLDDFHDLMRLAFMCDTTRVITFQAGNGLCKLSYPHLGFTDDGHAITHHGPDEEKLAKVKTLDAWRVSKFAEFLRSLKKTGDVDGKNLLHNTAVLYMSEIGDGDKHDSQDKPMVIAGQLGGRIPTGQVLVTRPPEEGGKYMACDEKVRTAKTPLPPGCAEAPQLSSLYMTLLGHMGIPVDSFGDFGRTPLPLA